MKTLEDLLKKYEPYPDPQAVQSRLRMAIDEFNSTIVVLDDDPTGTQTVQGITVVTDWTPQTLQREFERKPRMIFVLTNSRALSAQETERLHEILAENISQAAKRANRDFLLVSRSDSTLRGHFPLETEILREVLEKKTLRKIDGEILCPFFQEGGRYTAEDTHYLVEKGKLVPVGEPEFAKDLTFGYKSSNLKSWVEEKTHGEYSAEHVLSITLEQLRSSDSGSILHTLCSAHDFQKIVVNAISYQDLAAFVPILYEAIEHGKRFILRSAASILKIMSGCSEDTVCQRQELVDLDNKNGGLIVVGSHVKKTTEQLEVLKASQMVSYLEFHQHLVLDSDRLKREIARVAQEAEDMLREGKHVVIATSRRRLDLGEGDKEAELALAKKISDALVSTVMQISVRPNFVIGKGGITSSDVATRGLGIRRAQVLGQILPGIPVWKCGSESRFPGLTYVVFPGNVGAETSLADAVKKMIPEG